jgi:hypothetical protein
MAGANERARVLGLPTVSKTFEFGFPAVGRSWQNGYYGGRGIPFGRGIRQSLSLYVL